MKKTKLCGTKRNQTASSVFRLRSADQTIRTNNRAFKVIGENLIKKYIFITREGITTAPNGGDVENMQVIGIVENAATEDEALKKLLQENTWIFDAEFDVADFIGYEIV